MKKRILVWLMAACLMLGLLPFGAMAADASETAEEYLQLANTKDYTVYTKAQYQWSLDESGVYTSGSADTAKLVSSLKVVFKAAGVVSFDWSASGASTDYFAYRISMEDYAEMKDFTSQTDNRYTGKAFGAEEGITVAENDTLYFALFRYKADSTGTATVSNLCLSPIVEGGDTEVEDHILFDESMGSVAVDWMEQKSNYNNTTYYALSSISQDAVTVGQTYRLKATANADSQFYGWVREYTVNGVMKYEFMPMKYYTLNTKTDASNITYNTESAVTNPELEVTLDEKSAYRAVFAPKGSYVLRVNADFYDSSTNLADIINNASAGDVIEILGDITLTENATVPKGVLLYVPFRSGWSEDDAAGKYRAYGYRNYNASAEINETDHYATLTVSGGVNLTVNGTLAVGSVIGYNTQRYQGHVSGSHGRIVNNGNITVNSGGVMPCYGVVSGSGTVHVDDGAVLKEMFIIGDFAGGSNTAELFFTSQMPFKRFAMQRVQCTLTMEARAKLMAMMCVWANNMYNETEEVLVGDDAEAAFRPTSSVANTLTLTRTYNANKSLTDGNGLLDVTGIGRTEWTFSNGLVFQPLTVSLAGIKVDTGSSDFTIPYNFKINLAQGTYEIPLGMRIMPGAEIAIESGATVYVGGRLMIMDGLVQTDMSGDRYPSRRELEVAGFSGSGELTVNGTLIMKTGSVLGGLVKSNGGGKLTVEEGVYLNNSGTLAKLNHKNELSEQLYDLYTSEGGVVVRDASGGILRIENWVQQDGAIGAYDENTTWFNLPARILTADGVKRVQAGKTYVTEAQGGTAEYTVEYLYVEDDVFKKLSSGKYGYDTASGSREMTSATENLSRSVNAVWVDSEASKEEIPIATPVVAGKDDVTVAYDEPVRSGNYILLSGLKVVDKETWAVKDEKYVFLVKYTTEGSSTAKKATFENGVYSVSSEADEVLIEACLVGDIDGDAALTGFDVIYLRKTINGTYTTGELATLASDIDDDSALTGFDVIYLRKAINGSYTIS